MILDENQSVNVVVRGLVIEEGELVLTEWIDKSWSFLLGGRIDFGEHILDALHREMREEVNVAVQIQKLVYFAEEIYVRANGRAVHEYAYYFLVKPERTICSNGEVVPNPDSEKLIIRRTPITDKGLRNTWPRFLAKYLPMDSANQFVDCPRFLFNDYSAADGRYNSVQSHLLADVFGIDSTGLSSEPAA